MALIVVTILSTLIGLVLNSFYEEKYYTPAINWAGFALQCVFMFLALLTFPDPDVSGWFIAWLIALIVSYVIGLLGCREQAIKAGAERGDMIKAMIAQAILPFGIAVIVIIVIALILGVFSGKKKK